MNCSEYIASLVEHLAWPLTTVFFALLFYRPLKNLIDSIETLKVGDKELGFAERTKRLILGKTKDADKEKYLKQQVLYEGPGYKLYSNGILVQRIAATIPESANERTFVFPITFPNELTHIQVINNSEIKVEKANLSNCTISITSAAKSRAFEIVISGI